MLQRLTKILTNRILPHPRQRYVYAVTGGVYLGELLVYIKTSDNIYSFLTLPEMNIRDIPVDKFKFGIHEGIVDIVKKMPKYAYRVCRAQYNKNSIHK